MNILDVKKLAGAFFGDTNAHILYESDVVGALVVVKKLVIANNTAGAVAYTVYYDVGEGVVDSALLFGGVSLAANSSVMYDLNLPLHTQEKLRVIDGTGSALTFTIWGYVINVNRGVDYVAI